MSYDAWKLRSDLDEYQCACPRCSGSQDDADFWGDSEPSEPPYYEDEPKPITLRPTLSEPVKDFDDDTPF